jgi:hypothetical protein
MPTLPASILDRLIQIESEIHYTELPPPGRPPFVAIRRESTVILSAPHGALTFRNNHTETWHEEDEYTAGMVLLLSELCGTSVIATIHRTEGSDPNEHAEGQSPYKQKLRQMMEKTHARWVIDLHGAGEDNPRLMDGQKVELGTGNEDDYLPADAHQTLIAILEKHLGAGAADRGDKSGFRADGEHRMAAFAHRVLGLHSVQIEMKPSVRTARRRVDSSMYRKNTSYGGPYSAPAQNVTAMLQSLVEFIEYLQAPRD